jgi:exopolysaccharide biosynthesis polyprenyl glycosylphosphotransferase
VNATERAALHEGAWRYDEMSAVVDERTLAILEHRRKTAIVRRRGWLIRRMLLVADLVGLSLAFAAAQLFAGEVRPQDFVQPELEVLLFLSTLPIWIIVAKLYGLYDHDEERTDHSTSDDVTGVFHLVTIGTWVVFFGSTLTGLGRPELLKLVLFWGVAIGLVTLGRATARAICRRQLAYLQNTVIVGAGEVGQMIGRKVLQHPEYGINLVGFVDTAPKERHDGLEHVTVLGPPERLPGIVRMFDIERVVVAFSNDNHEETLRLIRSLKELDVQVDIVPRLFEILGPGVAIHTVEGIPLIGLPPLRLARSTRLLKRTMDIVMSLLGLLVLVIPFAVIAWRIKADSPGPVFFRQLRMGIGDRTFRICKFRTMVVDADERREEMAHLTMQAGLGDGKFLKIPDDPRVTNFGRFLRRYSLDELPQLINVLKGEMSLVGPRPLPLDEDERVEAWGRQRLTIKPGVTGLWQVLGRSDIPFAEMLKLDYLYVTTWSLWGDVRLIFRTVPVIFRRKGAY